MAVIGELATLVTAKVSPFNKGLEQASQKAKTFSSGLKTNLGGALKNVSSLLTGTAGRVTALAGALGVGGLLAKSVKLAAESEAMETSYKVYLKDLEQAKGLLSELTKFSDVTPFEPLEVKEAGKQLLAFGFRAQQILPVVKVLGDIAAGSQKPIADFVDILGKVKASGIASMGDINRLADRGVPIFQELSEVMGVAASEVRTLVGTGKVGFTEVWEALNNVTKEGGLFNKAMIELSETTGGKLSTLKGKITGLMTEVGTAIIDGLDIKSLQDRLVAMVGAYKTDIVQATESGVKALMAVLRDGPVWLNKIQTGWESFKWGAARISQFGQLSPGMNMFEYGVTGQNPLQSFQRKNQIASSALSEYERLKQKAVALEGRRKALANGTQQPTRQEHKQQRETLFSIYQEHARTNRLLERQIDQMQNQRTQVIPSF